MSPQRKPPRNPLIGFAFGLGWTTLTLLAFALFAEYFEIAMSGQLSGRSGPIVLATPFLYLAAAMLCIVRGFLALRPWNSWRASTTIDERRRDVASTITGASMLRESIIGSLITLVSAIGLAISIPVLAEGNPKLLLPVQWACLGLFAGITVLAFARHRAHYRAFRVPSPAPADSDR